MSFVIFFIFFQLIFLCYSFNNVFLFQIKGVIIHSLISLFLGLGLQKNATFPNEILIIIICMGGYKKHYS